MTDSESVTSACRHKGSQKVRVGRVIDRFTIRIQNLVDDSMAIRIYKCIFIILL
jgi:hypothetical protein